MGAVRRLWLVVALLLAACGGGGAEQLATPSAPAQGAPDLAAPVVNYGEPEDVDADTAWAFTLPLATGHGIEALPLTTVEAFPDLPKGWTLNLGIQDGNADSAASQHPHSHSHDESDSDPHWRDIAPGATDEGGATSDEYRQPLASLNSAWTKDSAGRVQVLRPATPEEMGGFRVIAPPPEAWNWMSRCVNHHADQSASSPWPREVRVAQALLSCTASAGLMEHPIQLYGAERGCVQRAYSDDYSAVDGKGSSWTQCPTIGNPTPLDGRPFAEKCRDAVVQGQKTKGHPPDERIADNTCGQFEAAVSAHLAVPGVTRLCAEHWVLNAVLDAEAPGAVPGLHQHLGVSTNGTC